jgi:hypothetical protein
MCGGGAEEGDGEEMAVAEKSRTSCVYSNLRPASASPAHALPVSLFTREGASVRESATPLLSLFQAEDPHVIRTCPMVASL